MNQKDKKRLKNTIENNPALKIRTAIDDAKKDIKSIKNSKNFRSLVEKKHLFYSR